VKRIGPALSPLLIALLALLLVAAAASTVGGCTSDISNDDSGTTVVPEGADPGAGEGEGADETGNGNATEDPTYGDDEPDSNAPSTLTLTADDNGGSFAVKKGGTVTLTLAENPSTGVMWEMQLDDPEASLIEQLAEPSFEPDDPGAEGEGGMTTFSFKAADAGEMVVRLVLLPPDEVEPDDTFEVTLTVR